MSRFDGYNRGDYHFPNTSREAFGMNWYPEKESRWTVLKGFAYYAAVVACLVILQWLMVSP